MLVNVMRALLHEVWDEREKDVVEVLSRPNIQ